MARFTLTILAVQLLLGTLASGQQHVAYDFGVDVSPLVKRKTDELIVVIPLRKVNGAIPERREIRQLQKNKDQWTLYILGLSLMQFLDQSEPLSFYQISGIHGAPYQAWSGVEGVPESTDMGYCHHRSVLFPTWHRPYVSLYEGMLYTTIQFIASLWTNKTDRDRYQSAAGTFRAPYWDWAMNPPEGEGVLPQIIGETNLIEVDGPNGVQQISNPLVAYGFKPLDTLTFPNPPWDLWVSTKRSPTSNDSLAESNNTQVARGLDRNLISIQQRLYTLFSTYNNYTSFSNEGWIPDRSDPFYDSLESLHDAIHGLTGGYGGHMSFIPFSAFDPIFFLHHAMVDRIFAMWQALYPDSWVEPEPAVWGTFTVAPGSTVNSTTDLTPFYASSNGTFWNSDTARDPHTFGYTYAEVAGLDLSGKPIDSQAQASLRLIINRLYGQSSTPSLVGGGASLSKADDKVPAPAEPGKSVIVDNKYREWTASIRVRKQAPGGTFYIHVFFGTLPDDRTSWAQHPNLVGTMSVLARPDPEGLGHQGPDTTGSVPLTAALVKEAMAGVLPNLEPDVVKPYLVQNLRLGITAIDGAAHTTQDVGIDIQIRSSSVHAPLGENEFPVWGKTTRHFEVSQ